jgi:hypothetical protein
MKRGISGAEAEEMYRLLYSFAKNSVAIWHQNGTHMLLQCLSEKEKKKR